MIIIPEIFLNAKGEMQLTIQSAKYFKNHRLNYLISQRNT